MGVYDDINREITVMMAPYMGKPCTVEVRKEIIDKANEILFVHKVSHLVPYFEGNKFRIKGKNSNAYEIFMICFWLAVLGCLLFVAYIRNPIILYGIVGLTVLMVGLTWVAKRDLKRIEAEKYGMTVEEFDKFNKTGKL